ATQDLRLPQVRVKRRWPLRGLDLLEDDMLVLQALADDFDDVTVGKLPGCSQEVEIHVVSPVALDISLDRAQSRVQQELVRLQKTEQDVVQRVGSVEAECRKNGGRLQPRHVEDLVQAEQLQQQAKARVAPADEGIRAEISRILQTLRANQRPPSDIDDRMQAV